MKSIKPAHIWLFVALAGIIGLFVWGNISTYEAAKKDTSSQFITLGQTIDGIPCQSGEMSEFHIHSHLRIFIDGENQTVPHGIGIGRPWNVTGDFVGSGSCFMWLHTHDSTGIIHIESPIEQDFTLGQLFDVWGRALTANSVLEATGPVTVYIDGKAYTGDPRDIKLANHQSIVIQAGKPVPIPPNFNFAAGGI